MIPVATYRVQLTPTAGFDVWRSRIGYLRALGVSHLYLSPIFETRPGSTHGYDITDPKRVRAQLDGPEAFDRLAKEARAAGLGLILDIVPNHMAAHHANPWWWGALRDGPGSPDAACFDIDWERGGGRVILPVLGDSLDSVLARDELKVEHDGALGWAVAYHDRRFPLRAGESEGDLRQVLDNQHYELTDWRDQHRNYRRFFDIDDLVGVRMEDERVFDRYHTLISTLWREGLIDGVRVDHIDGLARPNEYMHRLRTLLAPRGGVEPYIIVEKILAEGESIPNCWHACGTTGYEAVSAITRVFVTDAQLAACRRWSERAGVREFDFRKMVVGAKRQVAHDLFGAELRHLAELGAHVMQIEAQAIENAVCELAAHLRAYRTYFADNGCDHTADRASIMHAAQAARSHVADARALDAVMNALSAGDCAEFIVRFEQFCGPLMAKGMEDTALYRHAVLTALNDVGCEPGPTGGSTISRLHAFARDRARTGDHSMTPLSTHDSKRGEDARARILALADVPDAWGRLLLDCKAAIDPHSRLVSSDHVLLLQAAIAIWPDAGDPDEHEIERLCAYMTKAAREARRCTTWRDPDTAYESALVQAVKILITGPGGESIRAGVRAIVDETAPRTEAISLVQTVLRLTLPGVTDTYQGSEWENRSLVDPDNRGDLDDDVFAREFERRPKPFIISRLHALRRANATLFASGTYEPIEGMPDGVLAFHRHAAPASLVVCAPVTADALALAELFVPISPGLWTNALSDQTHTATNAELCRIEDPWRGLGGLVLFTGT